MDSDMALDIETNARDDRKSAALAAQRVRARDGARVVAEFGLAREVLRSSPNMVQAGLGHDDTANGDPQFASVFFLDGEPHRRRRTAIARFFTPKAISTRHRIVMEETTDRLLAELQAAGHGQLDVITFELAVAVAAEIVGLNDSAIGPLSRRISAAMFGTRLPGMNRFVRPFGTAWAAAHVGRFFLRDVRPAIASRRAQPREDVISHLIEEGYPDKAILMECLTYAGAGMVTTREFIVMAAWHLFDNDPLRQRFVAGDEQTQFAILEELLRLEPVASMLYRQADADTTLSSCTVADGELVALNLRESNLDPAAVGECPYAIDPDRAAKAGIVGAFLSFGDGSHRCPGAQVALTETRVFLDRLMRVPGIRLENQPRMTWNPSLESYELRRARIRCDRRQS
ncbi:cytochrome P450 [Jatrophihabitans sp. DSM 45814]